MTYLNRQAVKRALIREAAKKIILTMEDEGINKLDMVKGLHLYSVLHYI